MSDSGFPEADRAGDAPHPRLTQRLFGQSEAETEFLAAQCGDRLHHAWLITGPQGVGKATLAWRIARFLLSHGGKEGPGLFGDDPGTPPTLDVPADSPVISRVAALSEPGLLLIRRAWDAEKKRLKANITVDEVRRIGPFFGLSAPGNGHRVVIVDSADDLNSSSANALLKVLEEPPRNTILLLIAHCPSRLLPTIRSRCRELRARPLGATDLAAALEQAGFGGAPTEAIASLCGGSVGLAIRMLSHDGPTLYSQIVGLMATCPRLERPATIAFCEHAAARGTPERFELAAQLLDAALTRLAKTGAGLPPSLDAVPGEVEILARLSPDPAAARRWAELQQVLSARIAHGQAVNVDEQSLLLDAFLAINAASSAA